jgi:hypothetical protein
LVAAEDASFTLNGGLFDITANVGTTAGGASSVGGSITGPGGLGGQGIFSRIYMMAVPRNNAMTLLISGGAQLGFAVANAADVDGNAVVLSGGYDIVGARWGRAWISLARCRLLAAMPMPSCGWKIRPSPPA